MSISPQIQKRIMTILRSEEDKTDLESLSVLSRVGMKVASAESAELDADAISASSTALIDLGIRLSQSVEHGALREILLHNEKGYGILMAVNDEYLIFGALVNVLRIGYYMGYLREIARKINELISGGEETEMVISLQEEELKKLEEQKEKLQAEMEEKKLKPSVQEDQEAMQATLNFLKSWGDEGEESEIVSNNIVSIPQSMMVEIPTEPKIMPTTAEEKTEAIMKAQEAEKLYGIKVYPDEVPPIPLDDYTPIEIDETIVTEESISVDKSSQQISPEEAQFKQPSPVIEQKIPDETASYKSYEPPSFDEFEFEIASEYDMEFEIEEDEQFKDILSELGWEQDEMNKELAKVGWEQEKEESKKE
jgi:predicted regulator of Ras-like GTPase activity (Roadblock/LC7/MglB family)